MELVWDNRVNTETYKQEKNLAHNQKVVPCRSPCRKVYGTHLSNKGKGLRIMNPFNLWKSLGHKMCLVLVNKAICCIFGFIDPFTMIYLVPLRKRQDIPCFILQQWRMLCFHGNFPFGYLHKWHDSKRRQQLFVTKYGEGQRKNNWNGLAHSHIYQAPFTHESSASIVLV